MTKKQSGGKIIASGGFGCIFKPALKCENNPKNSDNVNKISKLMTTKHAKDEYKQIEIYNNLLKIIPNYENYFLVNNVE